LLNNGGDANFNAQFSGFRNSSGVIQYTNSASMYWTSTPKTTTSAWFMSIINNSQNAGVFSGVKTVGQSVRCVKN